MICNIWNISAISQDHCLDYLESRPSYQIINVELAKVSVILRSFFYGWMMITQLFCVFVPVFCSFLDRIKGFEVVDYYLTTIYDIPSIARVSELVFCPSRHFSSCANEAKHSATYGRYHWSADDSLNSVMKKSFKS